MIKFSQEINFLLENNLQPSLNILLEKDEESLFDMPDEDEEKKDEDNKDDESEGGEEDSGESDESEGDDEDSGESDEVTKSQFEKLSKDLEIIKSTILRTTSNDGIETVEKFISNSVSQINESKNYIKSSIKNFLNEDVDAEAVEADIEVLDRVLTKGTELVDKFKKGKDIDIEQYVSAAINAYSNFDNLFAKETIVKQAAINVLVLNSGANSESYIAEFEEMFHEELHKQFGIEYEEHALITKKFDNGSGAVKQA